MKEFVYHVYYFYSYFLVLFARSSLPINYHIKMVNPSCSVMLCGIAFSKICISAGDALGQIDFSVPSQLLQLG